MPQSTPTDLIIAYLELRGRTDRAIEAIALVHGSHLVCRERCCGCCINLTVFPVEFYAIQEELRARGLTRLEFDPSADCGLLKDDLCLIYASRPMICRTHGLPIVFLNDETDPPEYAVSFCPLNFAQADLDLLEFGPDNTFNIDDLNDALFELNRQFVEALGNPEFTATTRIPLERLLRR